MVFWRNPVYIRWAVNFICFATIFAVFIEFESFASPFERGFFCDDDSIRYPEKPDTFSMESTIAIAVTSALFTITVVFLVGQYQEKRNFRFPFWLWFNDVFAFAFGLVSCQMTIDIIKVTIGSLRPYFLSVCFPNASALQVICPEHKHTYITEYTCAATESNMRQVRMSFPSGHTTSIVFAMSFLVVYLHRRARSTWLTYLLGFFQLFLANVGLYVSFSRIADYKHHWSDVLGGGAFGLTFGLLASLFLLEDRLIPTDVMALPLLANEKVPKTYVSHNPTG